MSNFRWTVKQKRSKVENSTFLSLKSPKGSNGQMKIRYVHYFWTTFGKIEKIDFLRFFTCGSPKNGSIEYSTGPENMIECSRSLQNDHISCRKKCGRLNWPYRYVAHILWFGQRYPKIHIYLQNYLSHLIKQIT